MRMSQVVLTLSDDLAKEAEANGLLKPEFIASLLKAEIRRRKINKLFSAADHLAALDEPFTEAGIEEEIAATRKSRQSDSKRSTSARRP
jgi:hypothetical protein